MKFLNLAYIAERFPGRFGSEVKPAYVNNVDVNAPPPEERLKMAIQEVEAWLVDQIPVFAKAKADTLPAHFKAALADIACDSIFDTQGKDKERENSNSAKGRALILRAAPSYEDAKIVSGKIVMAPNPGLVNVQWRWKQ